VTQPKVVPLQAQRQNAAALPPIVNSLRQQARKQLIGLLKELLDCTDDALFEMADRSHSDADHHLYFDSMRQIRLHRSEIQKRFAEEVNERFDKAFREEDDTGLERMDLDDVALVDNDDLEVSVAISGIVSKITSQFSLPIMELTRRFDHLARQSTITERRNPLGPQMVSEAFAAALACLEVDIKIRIILLKLFERTVMQRMGFVYDGANRLLTEAGVLKDLRKSLSRGRPAPDRRAPTRSGGASGPSSRHHGPGPISGAAGRPDGNPAGSAAGGPHAGMGTAGGYAPDSAAGGWAGAPGAASTTGYGGSPGGGGSDAAGADAAGVFGTIQSLLAAHSSQPGAGPAAEGAAGAGATSAPGAASTPGTVIATPHLLNVLNAVQAESGQEQLTIDRVPPLMDLRQVVVSRAPDVTGEALNALGRADEDVVNFIGLLFDYILNDRNLAIPMKALIARLQIPIVKLAIIDKSFFDRSSHPARQLLNELSSAGIGWSSAAELKRDAVYDKIESVVIRVLNGFADNPQIFQELLDELRDFRARDTARNARMEQRVRDTESGRARTLAAKDAVQKVINQKACGMRLPTAVGRFLSDVWSRVLVMASVRDDGENARWESLIETLDDLLWSLQPLDDLDAIHRRDRLRPELLERLGAGISLIQLPDTEQQQWLATIDQHLEQVSSSDRAFLEDDEPAPAPDRFPEMEAIVLAPPHEVTDSYDGEAPEPAFLDKINRLSEGTWVEIRQQDGELLRCKLATIVKPGDRYVFVNRRGMKVAEKTRMALARELQDDRLVVLNDSQVFDRALQAVIGNLRQIQSESRRP
jgi:hypothetical protein